MSGGDDRPETAEIAESPEVKAKISEALDCLYIARNRLEHLLNDPPF